MSNFVIPIEEFNEKAELAAIGAKLSVARSELALLEQTKQDFINQQVEESQLAINQYVKNAKQALKDLSRYRQELIDFKRDITAYAEELEEKRITQESQIESSKETIEKSLKELNIKSLELERISEETKAEINAVITRKKLQDEREVSLNNKERAVNDKYETLARTINRINKK